MNGIDRVFSLLAMFLAVGACAFSPSWEASELDGAGNTETTKWSRNMNMQETNILETLVMPHGFDVDVDEGWRKLIARQFGGSPGRGFSELIQNFLDSYPSSTPWEKRRAEIESGRSSITITDWGEGMTRKRLTLLVTMGGTDKQFDDSKIGTFGIGFFSIFNPKLETRKVLVTTTCEGHGVELAFDVGEPEHRPELSARLLDRAPSFGTRVQVQFDNERSPARCLEYARRSLKYYPCRVKIDGESFQSVWENAKGTRSKFFKQGAIEGFSRPASFSPWVKVLCKFERILEGRPGFLATGGHRMNHDLRDYQRRSIPYVPRLEMIINSNELSVTISRDGLMMNAAYFRMIDVMSESFETALRAELARVKDSESEYEGLVVANQFVLARRLGEYIKGRLAEETAPTDDKNFVTKAKKMLGMGPPSTKTLVLRDLAEAKVYRLSGRKGLFSLCDLARMKSSELPLFHAPNQSNLRWLGGDFQHDFIVLPPRCVTGGGAPNLYQDLFDKAFGDAVDLDRVDGDQDTISSLVKRGIVSPESLKPDAKAVKTMELEARERELQDEINVLLRDEAVLEAVRRNLFLSVGRIEATFYKIENDKLDVASGLFDSEGDVLADNTGGLERAGADDAFDDDEPRQIFIGMRRGHPFVEHLKDSRNPHRAYFALTFLAHELAGSQKALVPHTPYTHFVKNTLCHDMRRSLLASITAEA